MARVLPPGGQQDRQIRGAHDTVFVEIGRALGAVAAAGREWLRQHQREWAGLVEAMGKLGLA